MYVLLHIYTEYFYLIVLVVFLGYISYSVYPIHFPILLGLCHYKINLWYIFPAFILLSVLGGYAMYRFVELPGIKVGRYLSDKQ